MVQKKLPSINSAHGSETRNIINELIKIFNGMGYTYDEALQKAHDVLNEAKKTNDMNKDVQDQINRLIISDGESDVEVIQARGDAPLLKDRLDKTDSQLAERPTKTEVRENTFDKPIDVDEMNTRTKQLFTGGAVAVVGENSVGRENVKPKAIDASRTNFIERTRNLFDGVYVDGVLGYANHGDGNIYQTIENSDSVKGKTAIIPIEANETYTIRVHEPEKKNVFRVAINNEYPVFLDGYSKTDKGQHVDQSLLDNNNFSEYTFTNTSRNFLLIYVSNDGSEPKLQVEKGSTATEYEFPFAIEQEYLGDANDKIKAFSSVIRPSKNLFNGKYVDGILGPANYEEGRIYQTVKNFGIYQGKTAIVPIETNETYTIKVHEPDKENVFRVAIYNKYPVFADGYNRTDVGQHADSIQADDNVLSEITITNTTAGRYLVIYVSNNGNEPKLQVEKGEKASAFEGYGSSVIDEKHTPFYQELKEEINELNIGNVTKNYEYNFYRDLSSLYRSPEITNFFETPRTVTVEEYHSLMQGLIDSSPNFTDYASYRLLGNDDFGYPMYEYELNPATYYIDNARNEGSTDVSDGEPMNKPKVVIVTNIHGQEKTPTYAIYYLFKAILEREDNPLIRFLTEQVHLVVVPLANPSGFAEAKYENGNGVNLNRGFPPARPGTEKEVQHVMSVIDAHSDADLFIDCHTKFNFSWDGYLGWSYTTNEALKNTINLMFQSIGQEWQSENPELPQNFGYVWSYNAPGVDGTSQRYAEINYGIDNVVLECSWMIDGVDSERYGEASVRMSKELIVNTITGFLRTKFID